jgi:hypothetical protein
MIGRVLFTVLVLVGVTAHAEQTFVATLVPQPNSGSNGTGTATLVLNDEETELSYTITVSGLLGPEIAAHIHRPDGAIAHDLPVGSPKIGVWQNLGLIDVFSLLAGQLFILIHTEANPGGELRGDIMQALPVEARTWGAIKALY